MSNGTDFARIAARNTWILVVFCVIGAALGVTLSFIVPKKFKSVAKISIQASYFQNPLVDNLVAPVTDPNELQGQRTALIQQALSDDFLLGFGRALGITSLEPNIIREKLVQFGLAEMPTEDQKRAELIDSLRQRIQFFPENSTTFMLSFSAGSPQAAQMANDLIVGEVKRLIFDQRKEALQNTQRSIENRAGALRKSLSSSAEPELLSEIKNTEADLSNLLLRFSPAHPKVQAEQNKLRGLKSKAPSVAPSSEGLITAEQAPVRLVFEDLVKKLNYLSVVLDMESGKKYEGYVKVIEPPPFPVSATFPKKGLFLMFGGVSGLLVGAMLAFLFEMLRRNKMSAYEVARSIGAPMLGELPPFKISGNKIKDFSKALPEPRLKLT